ncbi:MAG: hypothetical protein ABIA21_01635 [Candidatus Aenigmatarchaeota archaeon]
MRVKPLQILTFVSALTLGAYAAISATDTSDPTPMNYDFDFKPPSSTTDTVNVSYNNTPFPDTFKDIPEFYKVPIRFAVSEGMTLNNWTEEEAVAFETLMYTILRQESFGDIPFHEWPEKKTTWKPSRDGKCLGAYQICKLALQEAGTDCNGDNKIDPNNFDDAACSAFIYLLYAFEKTDGALSNRIKAAIDRYNIRDSYREEVFREWKENMERYYTLKRTVGEIANEIIDNPDFRKE